MRYDASQASPEACSRDILGYVPTSFASNVTLGSTGPVMSDHTQVDEGMGEIVLSAGEISTFPITFQFAGAVADEEVLLMRSRKRAIFIVCRIAYLALSTCAEQPSFTTT
jgi:hypothetical protein